MKSGLIIAGAPFCAEALFDARGAATDEKAARDTPIGPREIVEEADPGKGISLDGDELTSNVYPP